jgi:large subunit ribosomal protein L2
MTEGLVLDIIHSVGHNVPVAIVKFGVSEVLLPAKDGLLVGQKVFIGPDSETRDGNILPLGKIPETRPIFNVEFRPGDGGKIARSSGSYAFIVAKEKGVINVRLSSGELRTLLPDCRATLGIAAGAGRTLKPFAKAGKMHHKMHARNLRWPRSSASARNPVDHPFGGGAHTHLGKSQTVSHDTPPGRKVGSIAARSMGRGSSKKKTQLVGAASGGGSEQQQQSVEKKE